ncbi:hypothetical protein CA13_32920 [Planctomycetes bacterium CA13]|uniref:Uncharacterized protein n=1 Tax=Novipirellula herctigrandis TaxID=2527986 RepID=A0A5C5Z380_9BACT|nr:hypothetical protein CA13_32920 [Planctomycetes bacterium CA13]
MQNLNLLTTRLIADGSMQVFCSMVFWVATDHPRMLLASPKEVRRAFKACVLLGRAASWAGPRVEQGS